MKKLLIVGAGGHGKVVLDCSLEMGCYSQISFLEHDLNARSVGGHRLYFEQEISECFYKSFDEVIVAIGTNDTRLNKTVGYQKMQINLATLVHPRSVVSKSAKIGKGSVVLANATINPHAMIGIASIINTGALIEHDCMLGDGVHISPGSVLCGGVKIGEKTWVCAGCVVSNNVSIGHRSVIGAGAVVLEDIPADSLAYGVPARVRIT